jgi:hypothetical protein
MVCIFYPHSQISEAQFLRHMAKELYYDTQTGPDQSLADINLGFGVIECGYFPKFTCDLPCCVGSSLTYLLSLHPASGHEIQDHARLKTSWKRTGEVLKKSVGALCEQ